MILVDTNVISEQLRRVPEPRVVRWLDAQALETLYVLLQLLNCALEFSRWPTVVDESDCMKALSGKFYQCLLAVYSRLI